MGNRKTGDLRAHTTSVPGIANCAIRTWAGHA